MKDVAAVLGADSAPLLELLDADPAHLDVPDSAVILHAGLEAIHHGSRPLVPAIHVHADEDVLLLVRIGLRLIVFRQGRYLAGACVCCGSMIHPFSFSRLITY